jgi:hypothetical protein
VRYGVILLVLAVLAAGCTSESSQQIGENSTVSYENSVEYEKANTVHRSLKSIGWKGNASVEKKGQNRYEVTVNVTERPEKETEVPPGYYFQITLSRIQAGSFSDSDTITLRLQDSEGELIRKETRE